MFLHWILCWGVAHAAVFSGTEDYDASAIVTGLSNPWGLTFGPDDKFYITELSGKIKIIEGGRVTGQVRGIPRDLEVAGQGGLMDLVFHPKFARNGFVYISYSTRRNARPARGRNTRISRFKLVNNKLLQEKVLLQGGYGTDSSHFGSRLAFGKDGKLYATFGERHNKEKAQSLKYLNGKVVRINDDGSIPRDNPFVGVAGAREEIFTLGHRNPQGLDIHPVSGNAVISEHGPSGYDASLPGRGGIGKADEVNWLLRGRNYGWPNVFGDPAILPWTRSMHNFVTRERVVMPVKEFTIPDGIAPSGASFYTGNQFPKWKNDFFVAALRGYIMRVSISSSGRLVETEKIIPRGFSRLRDVSNGPGGNLYAITGVGQLIEIKPATGNNGGAPGNGPGGAPGLSEVEKIFKKHRCTTCHVELNDLGNLPSTWVSLDAKDSEIYKRITRTGVGRMPIGGRGLSAAEVATVLEWLKSYFNP